MPNGIVNSQTRLRSIRIPLELDGKVLAYAEQQGGLPHSKAFIELVAKGLGCNTPSITPSSTPQAIADLMSQVEALRRDMDHLRAGTHETQPQVPHVAPNGTRRRQKRGVFDPGAGQYLDAELCREGHVFENTGKTRRDRSGRCLECTRQANAKSRQRKAQAT